MIKTNCIIKYKIKRIITICILIFILMIVSFSLFVVYRIQTEENKLLNCIETEYQNSNINIESVHIAPSWIVSYLLTNYDTVDIVVVVSNDTEASFEERGYAVSQIRNGVQNYLNMYSTSEYYKFTNIKLSINNVYSSIHSVPNSNYYMIFKNQYDNIFKKNETDSIRLEHINGNECTFTTGEDYEYFTDCKSMSISVENISDFQFLQNYKNLECMAVNDCDNRKMRKIINNLPDGCELYVNGEKIV